MLLAFVGFDPRTAELRYTFGSSYLHDGLSLVPVFLGVYAIAEMIHLAVTGKRTISGKTRPEELTGSLWEGATSVFKHFGLFIRSSIIGTVIGMIPAVGGTVASFVAYGHAVQTAGKDRENFGLGDIRGVLAPEAAHDAKDGGSLVPTLAFGIPGSEGTALLLAMLTLHGLAPGKELMTSRLDLVFALIWSLFFSNWMTSIVGVTLVSQLARLTVIRTQVLAPVIFVLAALGAFAHKNRIEDVALAFGFGDHRLLLQEARLAENHPRDCVGSGKPVRSQPVRHPATSSFGANQLLDAPPRSCPGSAYRGNCRSAFSSGAASEESRQEGMTRINEKAALTLALLAFAGVMLYCTVGLSPAARVVPLAVLVPTLALLTCELVLDLAPGFVRRHSSIEHKDVFGIDRVRAIVEKGDTKLRRVASAHGVDCNRVASTDAPFYLRLRFAGGPSTLLVPLFEGASKGELGVVHLRGRRDAGFSIRSVRRRAERSIVRREGLELARRMRYE